MIKMFLGITLLVLAGAGFAQADPDFRGHPVGPTTHVVPEIDPASALSGLTLLLGGLTVLRGRIKKS